MKKWSMIKKVARKNKVKKMNLMRNKSPQLIKMAIKKIKKWRKTLMSVLFLSSSSNTGQTKTLDMLGESMCSKK